MLWDLHGLTLEAGWDGDRVGERWIQSFASRPAVESSPDLSFSLSLVPQVPGPPQDPPRFRQTDLLEYYLDGETAVAHFPRYGQLRLNLITGRTEGDIVPAALETYGVFEDLIAIGLSPHLRRRGMYLIHAFAAALPPDLHPHLPAGGPGVLIVGAIGSGKTTTGMALLDAGWKLLSNDSPIVNAACDLLSYPGLLAAYPASLARFEATRALVDSNEAQKKRTFAAESIWPDVWAEAAAPGAILFPQIEPRDGHALERLAQPEALRLIMPHAIEQWDREMIPAHFALLNELIRAAPAYRLRLAPEVGTLPVLIGSALEPLPGPPDGAGPHEAA